MNFGMQLLGPERRLGPNDKILLLITLDSTAPPKVVEDGFSCSIMDWPRLLGSSSLVLGEVSPLGKERIALHELHLHGDEV